MNGFHVDTREGGRTGQRVNMVDPAVFHIRVDGKLSASWSDEMRAASISVQVGEDGRCSTTLVTGPVDQAALIGVIVGLNALGLPLASVECLPAPAAGTASKERPS